MTKIEFERFSFCHTYIISSCRFYVSRVTKLYMILLLPSLAEICLPLHLPHAPANALHHGVQHQVMVNCVHHLDEKFANEIREGFKKKVELGILAEPRQTPPPRNLGPVIR